MGASRLSRFAIDDERRMKVVEMGGAQLKSFYICWQVPKMTRQGKKLSRMTEIFRCWDNSNFLKYSVKGHLLTAGMCHLCKADVVSITNAAGMCHLCKADVVSITNALEVRIYVTNHKT